MSLRKAFDAAESFFIVKSFMCLKLIIWVGFPHPFTLIIVKFTGKSGIYFMIIDAAPTLMKNIFFSTLKIRKTLQNWRLKENGINTDGSD